MSLVADALRVPLADEPALLERRSYSSYFEPESTLRTVANADGAEFAGVLAHPVTANAEQGGEGCRVEEVTNVRLQPKQLDDTSGDGFDIGRSQDLRPGIVPIRSMIFPPRTASPRRSWSRCAPAAAYGAAGRAHLAAAARRPRAIGRTLGRRTGPSRRKPPDRVPRH